MVVRLAVLSAILAFSGAGPAFAADPVVPRAGIMLRGEIKFPRVQKMYLQTGTKDGSRLTAGLGFYGKCKGGGLGELWASNIGARPEVRVRGGRFESTLTGSMRNVGGVAARTAYFEWKLSGRFTERDVAVATIDGTAEVRSGGKVISRCKIAEPVSVRLTVRSA